MGKYDNLMKEDVFEVFGEENVNKALDYCTQTTDKTKYYYRDDFVKKLKEHDRFTTAEFVLFLLKEKIITDKDLEEYYDNDLGNELRTGRYIPCIGTSSQEIKNRIFKV